MKEARYIYGYKGCLFIVTSRGGLVRLYTPFQVLCIEDSIESNAGRWGKIAADTVVEVNEVYLHDINLIGYEIEGVIHPYHRFRVVRDF